MKMNTGVLFGMLAIAANKVNFGPVSKSVGAKAAEVVEDEPIVPEYNTANVEDLLRSLNWNETAQMLDICGFLNEDTPTAEDALRFPLAEGPHKDITDEELRAIFNELTERLAGKNQKEVQNILNTKPGLKKQWAIREILVKDFATFFVAGAEGGNPDPDCLEYFGMYYRGELEDATDLQEEVETAVETLVVEETAAEEAVVETAPETKTEVVVHNNTQLSDAEMQKGANMALAFKKMGASAPLLAANMIANLAEGIVESKELNS